MECNIAHVVYASDNNFAEIMGVSLVSLLENSKDMENIHIYILDSGITASNKQKIESICKKYKRSVPMWIPAKNISNEMNINVTVDRGSLSQYARLFVSSVLPEDLDRVLYLDCDVVVMKSIKELWNLDMKGKTIAALMDAFSKFYRVNIDLQPNDIMFNSGVMLIDLKLWKEQKVEERLLKFIADKKGIIQQGDQGALNAVLTHDTFCFEPRFNSVTIFFDFSYTDMLVYRKPPSFYSEKEILEAVDNPSIVHFTTSFLSKRPWMEGCKHKYLNEWMKYKQMSPWHTEKLRIDKKSKWGRRAEVIYNKLPQRVSLYLAGIMQAYGRPIRNRIYSIFKL